MRSADGSSVRTEHEERARVRITGLCFELVIFLEVCCLCAGQGFAQNPQPENQPNTVRGTVVNAVTHEPIGRALVYSPDNRYAT